MGFKVMLFSLLHLRLHVEHTLFFLLFGFGVVFVLFVGLGLVFFGGGVAQMTI